MVFPSIAKHYKVGLPYLEIVNSGTQARQEKTLFGRRFLPAANL
jgi:hypothetical protein